MLLLCRHLSNAFTICLNNTTCFTCMHCMPRHVRTARRMTPSTTSGLVSCVSLAEDLKFITLAASNEKRNITVWRLAPVRPSVCFVGILAVTHQGAAQNAASVHFGPTIRRADILVSPTANRFKCNCTPNCQLCSI